MRSEYDYVNVTHILENDILCASFESVFWELMWQNVTDYASTLLQFMVRCRQLIVV